MSEIAPVSRGDVLAGKFRVDKVLGAGGMGVVVLAHHLQLDERVALKFLLPGAVENPEVVARFAREARAAVKIKSEHVARVSDVGTLENGSPYMVMEYLEGQDLSQVLALRGRFAVADAIDYVLQACEAIAEAHTLGIVHRDLKPANLFLVHRADGSPCVKVLDFGISKLTSTTGGSGIGSMTGTSTLLGSPFYMSPEQLTSSKSVDARTDIWALGVILYELLAGRVPFEAENIGELCVSILQKSPRPLSEVRPDVSPELERAISGALEKDRDRRFGAVADLGRALAPFAPASSQISVQRVSAIGRGVLPMTSGGLVDAPPVPTVSHGWGRSETRSPAPRRRLGIVLALSGLTLAGGLVYLGVLVLSPSGSGASPVPSDSSAVAAEQAAPPASTRDLVTPVPDPARMPPVDVGVASTDGVPAPSLSVEPQRPASPRPVATPRPREPRPVAAVPRPAVPVSEPAPKPQPVTPPSPPPAKPGPANDLLDGRR